MTSRAVDRLVADIGSLLRPPPALTLSDWSEKNLRLWEGPQVGERFRVWPYQREMIDAMADPAYERVSVIKPTRIGYTKGLVAAITGTAATAPCAMILLVPTDDDARGFAVDEIDPAFDASKAVRGLIRKGRLDGRNTLTRRAIVGGGSLKILAARSPRNLRRHDAKKLFEDEIDAMEVTNEGDPLLLAERRTLAHPDRKIIAGSTPTIEGVSNIERLYNESDQRVFEVPCPHCGAYNEILWEHIHWPPGEPDKAFYVCPANGCVVEEIHKAAMVAAGRWRITVPQVKGHAGFRLNALVSLFHNAGWGKLAAEYVKAKKTGFTAMQVFVNTVLGRTWKTSVDVASASALMERVEPFDFDHMPAEVLSITTGTDVQGDRLETVFVGWTLEGPPVVLGHVVLFGPTLEDAVWDELDELLLTKWRHPNGWMIGVDASAIDSSGQPGTTPKVCSFTAARKARRIWAVKGEHRPHPLKWRPAANAQHGAPMFLVGVDALKSEVVDRLGKPLWIRPEGAPDDSEERVLNPLSIRLSHRLSETWFEQATGEKRFIRYVQGRPVMEWKPKTSGQAVEALDCLVYAFAVRESTAVQAISWRSPTFGWGPTTPAIGCCTAQTIPRPRWFSPGPTSSACGSMRASRTTRWSMSCDRRSPAGRTISRWWRPTTCGTRPASPPSASNGPFRSASSGRPASIS